MPEMHSIFSVPEAHDLVCAPWAIHPYYGQAFVASLMQSPFLELTPEDRVLAEEAPGAPYIIPGVDATILPIKGNLARSRSWVTDLFDMITYDVLIERIENLTADDSVKTVIIEADSPGGHAQGLLAVNAALDDLRDSGTKVITYTEGLMASAMFHIAIGSDVILSTPDALVGSIGTVLPMYDLSALFREMGVKPEPIRSGKNKATPMPGEEITAEVKKPYQDVVDELSGFFFQAVSDYRNLHGERLETVTDGRIFTASQALPLGLIDRVVSNFNQALPSNDGTSPSGLPPVQSEDGNMPQSQKRAGKKPAETDTTTPPAEANQEEANAEAIANACAEAVSEARADDTARLAALRNAFPSDPSFVLDQFAATAGDDADMAVLKAKAARHDILQAEADAAGDEPPADQVETPAPADQVETDPEEVAGDDGDTPEGTGAVGGVPLSKEDEANATDPIKAYYDKVEHYRAKGVTDPRAEIRAHHPEIADAYLAAMNAAR